MAKLLEIELETNYVIIGERIKGGTFRPCQTIIPSSTIEGALRRCLGVEVPAVGFFEANTYEFDKLVYSVRDRFLNVSKLPVITACLRPKSENQKIKAKVYIPYDRGVGLKADLRGLEFQLGALKSKGFGKSRIIGVRELEAEVKQGILRVKVFEEEVKSFEIEPLSPVYGYLFKPDRLSIGGVYRRALFPGSLVEAPEVFLEVVTYYDGRRGCSV